MTVNFDAELKNFKGEPLKGEGDKAATLKGVVVNALLLDFPNEQVSGEEKFRRYKLAQAIDASNGEGCELKAEEAALVKSLIAKAYGPMVVGQAYELIEGS